MDAGKLKHELVEYAAIAAYLYVCFAALMLYKSAVLRDEGIAWLPHGAAIVKALILGKFLLIGEGVGLGKRVRHASRWRAVATKVAIFWVFLLLLSGLEEGVKAAIHGQSFLAAIVDFFAHPSLEMVASSVIMVLVLFPWVAAREAGAAPERS